MKIFKEHISAIILAGGKSSRMGSDKGLLKYKNKALVEYSIDAVKDIAKNIMIIANQEAYRQFNYPVYEDDLKDKGPIAGIYTGLQHSKTEWNLVLTCDAPFVKGNYLKELWNNKANALICCASFQGELQPLLGFYSKSCLMHIQKALAEERNSVKYLIRDLYGKYVNFNEIYKNINRPEDLIELELSEEK